MKSKIDEVIGALELISFNMPKEYDSDEIPAWWVSLFAVKEQLEQLRPFVELGEETIKWHEWLKDKSEENWDLKKVHNLIQQIKEQRDDRKHES